MAVKTVSTFTLPDEYQRQASEARRRRRMAEMLAQQAYEPGNIQNAPIPRGAPLVQGLQAFLAARAARKADEAEEGAMETQTREARQFLKALTDEDTVMDARQPAMPMGAPTVTAPEFEDGRIKTPAQIDFAAPPPMEAPQVQLSRYGNITPGQRRALALEGVLTSQNPLVQKIGQMQYGAMQPKQPEIGAVSPADFTPESLDAYRRTGNFSVLKMRDQPTAAPKTAAQDTLQWNPKTQKWEDIPGAVSRIRDIASARRPDVINTGSEPVVRIKGPDGKPIYVTRTDAIGKEPAPNPTNAPIMPPGIARDVAALQTKAQQFEAGNERAVYFRNLIKTGSLPLDVLSGVKYAAQRATDPKGTSRDSKGGKPAYVLYSELNRFVTEQVNTIMQLAKGTQTEGDALRAQQQILDNPNNSAVVLSALEDLERTFSNAQKYAREEAEYLSKPYEISNSNEVQEVDY